MQSPRTKAYTEPGGFNKRIRSCQCHDKSIRHRRQSG